MRVRRHDGMLGVFALPFVYPFSLFLTNNRLGQANGRVEDQEAHH
jgi:hypothetical protein